MTGWKKTFRTIFGIILLAALLFLFKEGEAFFRISEIRVDGMEIIAVEDILAASEIKKGMSIFLLQEQNIAAKIQNRIPRVENVQIKRFLPDTVVIEVSERTLAGYILTNDGLWLIDHNAYCFAYATDPGSDYPYILGVADELIVPGTPLGCPVRREALVNLFSTWPVDEILQIAEIDLSSRNNLIVYTKDGLEIWLGDGKEMTAKLNLIQQSIPHININSTTQLDVRSGKRLVVSKNALKTVKEVDP